MATAIDARGFDSGIPRTNARGSQLHRREAVFVAGSIVVCAGAVGLSILTGAWAPVLVG